MPIWQQVVTNCDGNPWFFYDAISFFVSLDFMAPIFVMTCHNFVCHETWSHEFTCMCMCTKQSMIFCDTISFCVSWIYDINICHGMPYFFVCHEVFEVMNSHACVCVLNNLLLIVIMTTILIVVLKKVTHNSLTFLLKGKSMLGWKKSGKWQ